MDKYEINYQYIIDECQLEGGGPFPSVTVSVNDGTLRRYTVNDSGLIPVEEDSNFRITLTAVNSVTRSGPSQPALSSTAEAGTCTCNNIIFVRIIIEITTRTIFTPQPLG